jgi:hypothetical protein
VHIVDQHDEVTQAFSEGFDLGASMNESFIAFSEIWQDRITDAAETLLSREASFEIAEKYLALSMYHNMLLKELRRLCVENAKLRSATGEELVENVIADILLVHQNVKES